VNQLAVVLAVAVSSQFDASDAGVGARIAWQPVELVGIEAEIVHYAGDFPEPRPFSRARVEGLFGATVGPRLDRVRLFARLRSGFVGVREAPEPFPCILIFPPPLACELASGHTLFALDAGGGVEIAATSRTFVRVDAGDRILRYPGPVFDNNRDVRERAFFSHDVRFAASAGLRF
jgi:hypothetical protein